MNVYNIARIIVPFDVSDYKYCLLNCMIATYLIKKKDAKYRIFLMSNKTYLKIYSILFNFDSY